MHINIDKVITMTGTCNWCAAKLMQRCDKCDTDLTPTIRTSDAQHDTISVPCFEMMHQVAEIVLYRSVRSLTLLCAGKVGVDMESAPSRKIVSGCRIGTINVCKFGRCFETADLICLFRASPILYSQKGGPGS